MSLDDIAKMLSKPADDHYLLRCSFKNKTRAAFDPNNIQKLLKYTTQNFSQRRILNKFSKIFSELFTKRSITIPDPALIDDFLGALDEAAKSKGLNREQLLKRIFNGLKTSINLSKLKIDTSKHVCPKLEEATLATDYFSTVDRPESQQSINKVRSAIFLLALAANPEFRSTVKQYAELNAANNYIGLLDTTVNKLNQKTAQRILAGQESDDFDIWFKDVESALSETHSETAGLDLSELSFECLLEELQKIFNANSIEALEHAIFASHEPSIDAPAAQVSREASQTVHEARDLSATEQLKRLYRRFTRDLSRPGKKDFLALFQSLFFDPRCPLLHTHKLSQDRDLMIMEAFFMKRFVDHFDSQAFSLKQSVSELLDKFLQVFQREILKKPVLTPEESKSLENIPTPVLLKKGLDKDIKKFAKSNQQLGHNIDRRLASLSQAKGIKDLTEKIGTKNTYTYIGGGALGGKLGIRLDDNHRMLVEFKDGKFYVLKVGTHTEFDNA